MNSPNDPGATQPPGDPAPQVKQGVASVGLGGLTLHGKGKVTYWVLEVEHMWWVLAVLISFALVDPAVSWWVAQRVQGVWQWAIGAAFGLAGIAFAYTVGKPKPVRRQHTR
jgi:hypothetical protein